MPRLHSRETRCILTNDLKSTDVLAGEHCSSPSGVRFNPYSGSLRLRLQHLIAAARDVRSVRGVQSERRWVGKQTRKDKSAATYSLHAWTALSIFKYNELRLSLAATLIWEIFFSGVSFGFSLDLEPPPPPPTQPEYVSVEISVSMRIKLGDRTTKTKQKQSKNKKIKNLTKKELARNVAWLQKRRFGRKQHRQHYT
jgi:hypothetical protein